MYITRVSIENYGAIEQLNIETQFDVNGNPKPLIITGQNGSGKTLLLTNIVDAMLEMKSIEEGNTKSHQAYKKGDKKYIHTGSNEYKVEVQFKEKDHYIDYLDIVSRDGTKSMHRADIQALDMPKEFLKTGCYKKINKDDHVIKKQILAYFPTDRYYNPAWFGKDYESTKRTTSKLEINEDIDSKIIKGNLLESVEKWMLDVLLDKYLYEQVIEEKTYYFKNNDYNFEPKKINEIIGYKGKNSTILSIIANLLTIIYTNKYGRIEYARIGVSSKKERAISIFVKKYDEPEFEIASDFSCLSSGEIMVLALFVSIIKEYDAINESKTCNLYHIEGIVMIDEIDQNLHIKFAKEILPVLISSFPKIQFILTTHSPFFMLGMQQMMGEKFAYINMPNGERLDVLRGYDEVSACYDIWSKPLS